MAERARVEPALLARVEAVLERENVDGKVPLHIFWRIVDDMASVPEWEREVA